MRMFSAFGLVLASALALGPGCAKEPLRTFEGDNHPAGGIQLGLDTSGAVTLTQATYKIDGPNNYHREVVVPLSNAPKLSTFIGGTPPGKGYVLTVTGVATDGVSQCGGVSAPFDVVAFKTTLVSLVLRCQEPDPTGSIQTNGSLNYCAAIDNLMASPIEAAVGGTIALSSGSHDKDMGPAPIKFAWSASTGSFDDVHVPGPTFTCTTPGPVNITLTVTDTDCGDSRSVTVNCTGSGQSPPPPDAGSALPPADGGTAADSGGGAEASPQSDWCLVCEASNSQPGCAVNYYQCVNLTGNATAGPGMGKANSDLCVGLYTCVHATRCDRSGALRDCFCGPSVDDATCHTNPNGACRSAFYEAGQSTDNATILARLHDTTFALGVGAVLIEECEEKPAPLCGPSCGF